MNSRILRFWHVSQLVGLGRTTIYAGVKAGTFPKPVKLSAHAVGWRSTDIEAWLAEQQRRQQSAAVAGDDVQRHARAEAFRKGLKVQSRWDVSAARKNLRLIAGEGPCVYLAYRNDTLLYVGMASIAWKRLGAHLRHWLSPAPSMAPTHFDIIKGGTVGEVLALETKLIDVLLPPLNRRYPRHAS